MRLWFFHSSMTVLRGVGEVQDVDDGVRGHFGRLVSVLSGDVGGVVAELEPCGVGGAEAVRAVLVVDYEGLSVHASSPLLVPLLLISI